MSDYEFVDRLRGNHPERTGRVGKWCLWLLPSEFEVWRAIAAAVESGDLGFQAKTDHQRGSSGEHFVAVYTYDSDDEADIMRVRDYLLDVIGVKSRMSYKTDQQTHEGIYAHRGHTHISKYWVPSRR